MSGHEKMRTLFAGLPPDEHKAFTDLVLNSVRTQ